MNKLEQARDLAEELLEDIELQRLKASEIVLKASRIARLVGHEDLTTFTGFERNGYSGDGSANEWIGKTGRWSGDDDGKFYPQSIGQVDGLLESAEGEMGAMRGGNYSGDMIAIAAREHDARIISYGNAIARWSGISRQVVATIYDLVTEIYHELLFSELQATLFADTQARVDGSLAEASGSALNKIERVSDRLRDGDPESVSQALTTCRRLIDSCADHVFPSRDDSYEIAPGTTLAVGKSNVLNRIAAHVREAGAREGRSDRLRRTLRDLYERCSAGTHADVTVDEARFVFLQTYVVLGEVLTLRPPAD